MSIRKAVGAIIKWNGNYILVHKAANSNKNLPIAQSGAWDFVKGGVKAGESFENALKRELYEELSITDYRIIKRISKPLTFYFPSGLPYEKQETVFYIVELIGSCLSINVDGNEIDQYVCLKEEQVLHWLTHKETQEYFAAVQSWVKLAITLKGTVQPAPFAKPR